MSLTVSESMEEIPRVEFDEERGNFNENPEVVVVLSVDNSSSKKECVVRVWRKISGGSSTIELDAELILLHLSEVLTSWGLCLIILLCNLFFLFLPGKDGLFFLSSVESEVLEPCLYDWRRFNHSIIMATIALRLLTSELKSDLSAAFRHLQKRLKRKARYKGG